MYDFHIFDAKNIEELEAIGLERDLAGFPVIWVPANVASPTTPEERVSINTFMQIVTNVRRDKQEGVVMPLVYDKNGNKMYDFTLMSSGGKREFDTSKIIDRWDTRITQSVLADFIMLGTKNVGSFALSSSKTELFSLAIGFYLDTIQDVFNSFAIPRLFALNPEFKLSQLPRLVHGDIETADLAILGEYLGKLNDIGVEMFPDESLEKYLFNAANLPKSAQKTTKKKVKKTELDDTLDSETDKLILSEMEKAASQASKILEESGLL